MMNSGMYVVIGASRSIRPRSTRSITEAAVNILLVDPIPYMVSAVMGLSSVRLYTPALPESMVSPWDITAY
ncbi:MAG: hypothetical protein BWY92_01780 [Firmicutes bacterium ADurb.BinA052]|nr:MAG: hypothetical protein BWY92_01780 [Firmicutes bacterium ADurb.BinA052]